MANPLGEPFGGDGEEEAHDEEAETGNDSQNEEHQRPEIRLCLLIPDARKDGQDFREDDGEDWKWGRETTF